MSIEIPDTEPTELVIGTSWDWDKSLSLVPPSGGWTLTYHFEGPGQVADITAATSGSGDYYEVREAPVFSSGLTPGSYVLVGQVADGTDTHEVYRQTVVLLADVAADPQIRVAFWERYASALEGALLQIASTGMAVTTVNGQKVEWRDPAVVRKELQMAYGKIQLLRTGGKLPVRKVAFRRPT